MHMAQVSLSRVFAEMTARREELRVRDWGIANTTLEEAFIKQTSMLEHYWAAETRSSTAATVAAPCTPAATVTTAPTTPDVPAKNLPVNSTPY